MAHGGGRGWFHRRKPRPEPEPIRAPEPTRLEAFEAEQATHARTNGNDRPVTTALVGLGNAEEVAGQDDAGARDGWQHLVERELLELFRDRDAE